MESTATWSDFFNCFLGEVKELSAQDLYNIMLSIILSLRTIGLQVPNTQFIIQHQHASFLPFINCSQVLNHPQSMLLPFGSIWCQKVPQLQAVYRFFPRDIAISAWISKAPAAATAQQDPQAPCCFTYLVLTWTANWFSPTKRQPNGKNKQLKTCSQTNKT